MTASIMAAIVSVGADIVHIFAFGAVGIGFLHWLWPRMLEYWIRRKSAGHTKISGWLHSNTGAVLLFIALAFAMGLSGAFVLFDEGRSWTDVDSAVGAVVIVVAILFGYGRLFPPAFWPTYLPVTDPLTGAWNNDERLAELTVRKGQEWPIFLEVYNTGIAPWNNYRITVIFEDGFETFKEHDAIPGSKLWDWETKGLRAGKQPQPHVQVQGGNTLAVGEPQTIRFVVHTPDQVGRFKVQVTLVADGRLSESERVLWLNVTEAASFATQTEPTPRTS